MVLNFNKKLLCLLGEGMIISFVLGILVVSLCCLEVVNKLLDLMLMIKVGGLRERVWIKWVLSFFFVVLVDEGRLEESEDREVLWEGVDRLWVLSLWVMWM